MDVTLYEWLLYGHLVFAMAWVGAEVQRRISRVLLFARIELVLLILIVLDMVVKPGP